MIRRLPLLALPLLLAACATTPQNTPPETLYHARLDTAQGQALTFELPPVNEGCCWRRIIDTALPSPGDAPDQPVQLPADTTHYTAEGRSVVLLQRMGEGEGEV